jgi:hypothetical protein
MCLIVSSNLNLDVLILVYNDVEMYAYEDQFQIYLNMLPIQ